MYEGRKMGNLRDSLFFVSFWMFLNCLMVPPLSNIKMTTFTNSTKKKMKRKQRQTVNEMYRNRLLIYHFRLCIWYHLFYIVDTFFSLAIALSDFSAAHSIDFSPSLFIWSGYKKNHVKIKHKPIACIYKTVEIFRHNFKLRCLLFVFRSLKLVFHWIHFPLQDFFFFVLLDVVGLFLFSSQFQLSISYRSFSLPYITNQWWCGVYTHLNEMHEEAHLIFNNDSCWLRMFFLLDSLDFCRASCDWAQ